MITPATRVVIGSPPRGRRSRNASRSWKTRSPGSGASSSPARRSRAARPRSVRGIPDGLFSAPSASGGSPEPRLSVQRVSGGSPVPLLPAKSVSGGSPEPLPAARSVSGGSPEPLPAARSVSGGSPGPLPAARSVSGGSPDLLLAEKRRIGSPQKHSCPPKVKLANRQIYLSPLFPVDYTNRPQERTHVAVEWHLSEASQRTAPRHGRFRRGTGTRRRPRERVARVGEAGARGGRWRRSRLRGRGTA